MSLGEDKTPAAHTQEPSPLGGRGFHAQLVAAEGWLALEKSPGRGGAAGISWEECLHSDLRCAGEARLLGGTQAFLVILSPTQVPAQDCWALSSP